MKEKPILFSGPMVRAILDGPKTQTRRVIKPLVGADRIDSYEQLSNGHIAIRGMWFGKEGCGWYRKPLVMPGDRLWAKETWGGVFSNGMYTLQWRDVDRQYRTQENCAGLFYRATDDDPDYTGCWVPSIFMPRWASRITLEVTAVRAELVQDITEEDAIAEGITLDDGAAFYTDRFADLWDSINGKKYPWASNPAVWVYTFKQVQP